MNPYTVLRPFIGDFLNEQQEVKELNKQKLKEIKQEYWDACNLPRKKKKQARKKAVQDYIFFTELGKWHDRFIPEY